MRQPTPTMHCQPELVEKIRPLLADDSHAARMAEFFRIMGDCTRMRLLMALDHGEICVCDLAALLDMSKSAVSHQLRALKDAQLVKGRRHGKHIFYSLDDEHVHTVLEMAADHLRHP